MGGGGSRARGCGLIILSKVYRVKNLFVCTTANEFQTHLTIQKYDMFVYTQVESKTYR